jgi:hypothetical protein
MRKIYYTMIAILSVVSAVVPTGTMLAYGIKDQNNNDQNNNDPRNQACYNSGFGDGRQNTPYSQNMFSQCGINGRAYYEGFLSGCISGQGKDYFSCQKLTNTPIGGSSGSSGGGSNGQGGGGGFNGFGGGGSSGQGGGGGGGSNGQGGGGGGGSR